MTNPYEDVNWQSVIRIASATHMHLENQSDLDNGYRWGLRHFPISNYYPSAPYDADTRLSDFKLRQSWATKCYGKPVDPPVNWNNIINWQEELEKPYKACWPEFVGFPFGETEPVYSAIPRDVILSHNAEHHGFTNSNYHICSPGSSFASGTFDVGGGHYRLDKHGFQVGYGGTWQEGFEGMLKDLDYPEAGGITINHPTRYSRFSDDDVLDMLDFDESVLGIEIYNDCSAKKNCFENPDSTAPPESEPGFSLNLWDRILSTGRKCWGFCVPDHRVCKGGNWHGRNVLLASEFAEYDCLRAYREGRFYGCLKDNGLTISDYRVTGSSISVTTSATARIKFITEAGLARTITGPSATYQLPEKSGVLGVKFVRVEVENDSGERLFLQPVTW